MAKKKRKRNKKCYPRRWRKVKWYISVYETGNVYSLYATTPDVASRKFKELMPHLQACLITYDVDDVIDKGNRGVKLLMRIVNLLMRREKGRIINLKKGLVCK